MNSIHNQIHFTNNHCVLLVDEPPALQYSHLTSLQLQPAEHSELEKEKGRSLLEAFLSGG